MDDSAPRISSLPPHYTLAAHSCLLRIHYIWPGWSSSDRSPGARPMAMAGGQNMQVLSALDGAKTQRYHFTAIVVAGMGFFTDAYDLFCISLVTKLIGRIYYTVDGSPRPGSLPPHVSAAVNGVAFVGTLSGQLFFGWLGDRVGRKSVYGMTLLTMVVCSVASGLSFGRSPACVMATLCFFRFWLGFGIGGDYPLSATIMSEYANKRTRGAFVAAVFAMQGFGILAGGAVAIGVTALFRSRFPAPPYDVDPAASTPAEADLVWRIILMFGAVPAALTFYSRMKMPETARYTALVARNAERAAADMSRVLQVDIGNKEQPGAEEEATTGTEARLRGEQEEATTGPPFGLFSREFAHRHGLHLVGTASTWLLLDIAYYSQNLLLRQLRAQRHDLHRACGNLPGAAPRDVPRHLGGVGQGGRHHRVLRVPVPGAEPGPGQDGARVRAGHRRAQLAAAAGRVQLPGVPAHVPGAGAQGQVARGDVARDGAGRRRAVREGPPIRPLWHLDAFARAQY
uniref:H(+)/Pi cotransporter n=1 Tax=Zea mays TaxID=4577 RepID=C4J5Q9_MAIZE|nr:unknown [Zea mays]